MELNNDINKKQYLLAESIRTRPPSCGLIIIDNFYNNAMETREYILTQDFKVHGTIQVIGTRSFATNELKNLIQDYVFPFGGKITEFPMPNETNINDNSIYNGAFQYTTSRDRSWVHIDGYNNWAGGFIYDTRCTIEFRNRFL